MKTHLLPYVLVPAAIVASCGDGGGPAAPSLPGKQLADLFERPAVFDMLDYMLNESDTVYAAGSAASALPTWRISSNGYIECKFGNCAHHEYMQFDENYVYLSEDHSMNGYDPNFVYALDAGGRAGRWAKRFNWQVGESLWQWCGRPDQSCPPCEGKTGDAWRECRDEHRYVSLTWYRHGACSVWKQDALRYRMTLVARLADHDFGGDLGRRDAVIVEYDPGNPETNIYARGAGRVGWTMGRIDRPAQVLNVAVPRASLGMTPADAQTCSR